MVLRPFELNQLTDELPGYTLVHSYRAGIPIYECSLSIRVMAAQDVSPLEMAVLKCVGAGVDTPVGIDFILGAGRTAATTSLSSLLSLDLVMPGSGRSITEGGVLLTDKGAEALADMMVLRPEQSVFRVLHDGFTGEMSAPGRVQLLTRQEMERAHVHMLPSKLSPPEMRDIDAGRVRDLYHAAQRANPAVAPERFHDIVDILRTVTMYRPCTVAIFDPPDDGQIVFRVLDRGARMPSYERLLAALSIRQPEVLPFSERFTVDETFPSLLDENLVAEAAEVEREAAEVRRALFVAEEAMPVDHGTEAPLAESVSEELMLLRKRNDELEAHLGSLRLIDTYEHRPLLERAFRNARKRVIVISPWMSPAAVNHDLLDLMARALDRNVEVVIGWGMPPSEFDNKGTYGDEKTKAVLRRLEALRSKKKNRKLRVVRLGNTHEKVLVKDEEFVVVTSFNWFSFRGDPRRGFRQETGVYYSIPEKVREDAAKLMERIEAADPTPNDQGSEIERAASQGDDGTRVGPSTTEVEMKGALDQLKQKFPPKHKR